MYTLLVISIKQGRKRRVFGASGDLVMGPFAVSGLITLCVIVVSIASVVEVSQLRNVTDPGVPSHLNHRVLHRLIVEHSQVPAIFVLVVFLVNLLEQLRVECPQWAHEVAFLPFATLEVVLADGLGPPIFEITHEVVGVHQPDILGLVGGTD